MIAMAAATAQSTPTTGQVIAAVLGAASIGSVFSSIITGLFLRSQSRAQDRRETARLEDERKRRNEDHMHERELRQEVRRQELEDHWRDARHAAHVEALSMLDAMYDQISLARADEDRRHLPGYATEPWIQLRRAEGDVSLICSDAAGEAVKAARKSLRLFQARTRNSLLERSDSDGNRRAENQADGADDSAVDAIAAYRQAVRRDLGTATVSDVAAG